MAPVPVEQYTSLLRRIAWDTLPCPEVQSYMPVLELVPPSEEGFDVEHRDSHRRMALQHPLQDQLTVYSAMTARVLAALAISLKNNPEEKQEVAVMVSGQFAQTIHVGASVVIAQLLDQGYLQLGPKAGK